jgi:hypothetical protein
MRVLVIDDDAELAETAAVFALARTTTPMPVFVRGAGHDETQPVGSRRRSRMPVDRGRGAARSERACGAGGHGAVGGRAGTAGSVSVPWVIITRRRC